jgi:integrase
MESFESVVRWHTKLKAKSGGRPTSTSRVWDHYLKLFCEKVAHKNPDELIAERREHLKSDDEFIRRKHEELVTKFILKLQKHGAPPNTVNTAVAGIRSFYAANYLPLTSIETPRGISVRTVRIPTPEDLRKVCEVADPMTKAYILCAKDCGMAISDMLRLSLDWTSPLYGSLKQQLKNNRVPLHLYVVREKTSITFNTFLGPDAIQSLKDWPPPRLVQTSSRLFPCVDKTIRNRLALASIRAKLGYVLQSHALRKFFTTYLKLAGVNEALVEYWCGHSLGAVRGAYFMPQAESAVLPRIEEMAKVYMENYKVIRVLSSS